MLAQNRQLEELEIQYVDDCPEFQRLLTEYLASVERGGAPRISKSHQTGTHGKGEVRINNLSIATATCLRLE